MGNELILAVAGSRKTQGIVERCQVLPLQSKALVVTFTQANQIEIKSRLDKYAGAQHGVEILGWYSFLLKDFAKPFFPFMFPRKRVCGFNFHGRPHRFAKGINRFCDSNYSVFSSELAKLAHSLLSLSQGALIHRLECIYNHIFIDEVQDCSGYDWDILEALMESSLNITMVGDVRQSVLSTNPRGSKNRRYAYSESIHWFREMKKKGLLNITEKNTTFRCQKDVAEFSDKIFDEGWSFPKTVSANHKVTGHDGVFLIHPDHVYEYVKRFSPQCLRSMVTSGTQYDLSYLNFKASKGMSFFRVLVVPTEPITKFIRSGVALSPVSAAAFYVAVTRAEQSVGLVIADRGGSELPYWTP